MRMKEIGEGVTYSFEFFPPKDPEGEERLWSAMRALEPIAPDFISVTYGAGGTTRDRTIRITSEITQRTHIPTVAHLTCVGSTRDELIEILARYKQAGIHNIRATWRSNRGTARTMDTNTRWFKSCGRTCNACG